MTHTHTHLLTTVHLFWTNVLSGSTAQVSGPSFVQRLPHLFPPPGVVLSLSARSPFSVRGGPPNPARLTVLCSAPFALDTRQEAAVMWRFGLPSVQRLWRRRWLWCVCSWLALAASLVYTVVQPLSGEKKSQWVGSIFDREYKGKLATPQRSCYFFFLFFFPHQPSLDGHSLGV